MSKTKKEFIILLKTNISFLKKKIEPSEKDLFINSYLEAWAFHLQKEIDIEDKKEKKIVTLTENEIIEYYSEEIIDRASYINLFEGNNEIKDLRVSRQDLLKKLDLLNYLIEFCEANELTEINIQLNESYPNK